MITALLVTAEDWERPRGLQTQAWGSKLRRSRLWKTCACGQKNEDAPRTRTRTALRHTESGKSQMARRPVYLKKVKTPYSYCDRHKQNGAGPCGPCPLAMSSACFLSVGNFSQRISLIREVRNVETKENSQRRLHNNNVTKHSQGLSVLSQGLTF